MNSVRKWYNWAIHLFESKNILIEALAVLCNRAAVTMCSMCNLEKKCLKKCLIADSVSTLAWSSNAMDHLSPLKRPVDMSSPKSPLKKSRDFNEIPKFEECVDGRDNLDEVHR